MAFALDERLEADSVPVCDFALCTVRLMNDARFPWLILVPKREGLEELIDLSEDERMVLMNEISLASKALKKLFNPRKLNVAALGNMVSQLHVHVIVRQENDAAWPNPIWGHGTAEPYTEEALRAATEKIAGELVSD